MQREVFENQQEITTITVIWARQLVSPQPKLGPVPLAERQRAARADEFDAVGGACGEASEMAIAVLHGVIK